jgi:hypothetical protein
VFGRLSHTGVVYVPDHSVVVNDIAPGYDGTNTCEMSWPRWERTIGGVNAQGQIAFRRYGSNLSVIWTYEPQNVVAEATGPATTPGAVCRSWYYNG